MPNADDASGEETAKRAARAAALKCIFSDY